jgi:phage I-like protein
MQNRPPVRPVAPPPPNVSPVDDLIQRVTPLSAQWLQNNRDNLKDPRSFRIMARAHEDAVDHGIIPESDEYFRFVESRLGFSKGETAPPEPAMSAAAAPVQRRQSPPAAPVSRQPSTSSGNKPHVVKLTPEQREAARISGVTEEEYARQMIKERNRVH